jgi:hypothetical protein
MPQTHPLTRRRIAHVTLLTILVTSEPATAAHGSLECPPPESMGPLLEFIDTVAQLAFTAGFGIASLGLIVAGVLFMAPGEDNTRRAKQVLKNTLIGAVILLSSDMILAFMVTQLGGATC